MPKRLYIIINPDSGTGDPSDVLATLKSQLKQRDIDYTMKIVHKPDEAQAAARRVNQGKYDALAVYGGDGTIIAIFKAIYTDYSLPVLLLPGGSANALAKALNLSTNIEECLDLYLGNLYLLRQFGVAIANDKPFILDLHFGVWADSIQETSQATKQKFGQYAYALQAIKQFRTATKDTYRLTIDGKQLKQNAYACLVANEGFHNIAGIPLFSHVNTRGWLQLALVKRTSGFALTRWLFLRRLGRQDASVIMTKRAKEVVIEKAPRTMFFDDESVKAKLPLVVKSSPYTITVIVSPPMSTNLWERLRARANVQPYRILDHTRRIVTGKPSVSTSQVAPSLYVGGQYRGWAASTLRSWGVTGVVNMRNLRKPTRSTVLEVLNLPTPDHQPPTLANLHRGVEFIDKHIQAGGSAYVHCRLGEGRGPTMAAAYLISQGMRARDAVAHIERFRRQSRPNAKQLRQLARFEAEVAALKRPT